MLEVVPGVACIRDTCNVYVLRSGRDAVVVDFGSGEVLDRLGELGIDRITDVLVTHHHRDQVQGLARAAAAGVRIWVPPVEQDLIARADRHWRMRRQENDYDLRQDRFSLLDDVPIAGTVAEYRTTQYGDHDVYVLPTPGHTIGSVTYLVGKLAFCGDLIYGDGKVWSLAATQWTYGGVEGQAATVVSAGILGDLEPELLLPSHGDPIDDPAAAIGKVRASLKELLQMWRPEPEWGLDRWQREPWAPVTPHLLRARTCEAHSYALLSETGSALLIDWDYDLNAGMTNASMRETRRPPLASLPSLKRDYGVERIEVVVPTHFHDDHVAGLNLLRDVEGTEVWAPANVSPILEEPRLYDLPCLWFDPIAVDRVVPLGEPIRWHEYELTPHPLPGHTLYAVAISFEVDGKRIVAGGDHWPPLEVTDAYLDRIEADGRRLAELHRELLPLDDVDFGAEGFGTRISPYRSTVGPGKALELDVEVRNPFAREETAVVELVTPWGNQSAELGLAARGTGVVAFTVTPGSSGRAAADLTVAGVRFGQQAEAPVEVE